MAFFPLRVSLYPLPLFWPFPCSYPLSIYILVHSPVTSLRLPLPLPHLPLLHALPAPARVSSAPCLACASLACLWLAAFPASPAPAPAHSPGHTYSHSHITIRCSSSPDTLSSPHPCQHPFPGSGFYYWKIAQTRTDIVLGARHGTARHSLKRIRHVGHGVCVILATVEVNVGGEKRSTK